MEEKEETVEEHCGVVDAVEWDNNIFKTLSSFQDENENDIQNIL